MTTTIIATKLLIPKPRQGLVSRRALLDGLGKGIAGRITLISASSGYGKTTLMAEWLSGQGKDQPAAWVSLDKGDNDPVRFLSYVTAALQNIQDGLGADTNAMMQGAQNPPDETVLSVLINELSTVPNDFALILEDYHVIETRQIHQMMAFLLEHLPPQVHVVILTRHDPPFPLARMRAHGQLSEIRARDLRFSSEDAVIFLNEILKLSLSEEDVQTLLERTEGWVTGLQLAALSIRGSEDPSTLISSFGSSHDYIVDYLLEEVLEHQPENLKLFLMQTSILDRMNGPLCEALTQQPGGESTLEWLDKSNLFVFPFGGRERWYRYHHLFADVLKNRLQRFFPEQQPELHIRAARWFEENGSFSEAIEHALAANNHPLAADIVQHQALKLLKLGNLSTLMGWLNRLPPEIINARPWLGVDSAWLYLLIGKTDNIEPHLATAEKNLDGLADANNLRGHIAAIRSYATARMGNPVQALEQAQLALELLPAEDLSVRCVVTFVLGGIHFLRRDPVRAVNAMKEAGRLGEQAGNIHVAVSAMRSVGDVFFRQGNLVEAEAAYYQGLRMGTGPNGQPLPIAAGVFGGLADIRLAQRKWADARKLVSTGLELAEKWGNTESKIRCYIVLAHLEFHEGNWDDARAGLENAKRITEAYRQIPPDVEELIASCEALLSPAPSRRAGHVALIEPLSERELEILRLFAGGLSNQDIAEKLIISLGTVKAHSSNIYRKLDANNRAQAIIRAQELKLL